jgi:hypothetical protein
MASQGTSGQAGGPAGGTGGAGVGNTSTYDYYEIGQPGEKWAGRGRQQRHAQRQRARGAGMGALGENFANANQFYMGQGQQARGMQLDQYGVAGAMGDQFGGLASAYQDLSQGRGRSLAQAQLAQSTRANTGAQLAAAAQGRGGNLGAQARQAAAVPAANQVAQSEALAGIRAQEQAAGMQGMGQAMQMQAGSYSQQAAIADAMRRQAQAGEMGYGDLALQHQLGHRGLDVGAIEGRRAFATNLVGSILGGGGGAASGIAGAAMASDERVKHGVSDSRMTATEAVGKIPPKSFEYDQGYGGPGQRLGQMAQDVAKVRPELVSSAPDGTMQMDIGGVAGLSLAASSEMAKKVEDLERKVQAGPYGEAAAGGAKQAAGGDSLTGEVRSRGRDGGYYGTPSYVDGKAETAEAHAGNVPAAPTPTTDPKTANTAEGLASVGQQLSNQALSASRAEPRSSGMRGIHGSGGRGLASAAVQQDTAMTPPTSPVGQLPTPYPSMGMGYASGAGRFELRRRMGGRA